MGRWNIGRDDKEKRFLCVWFKRFGLKQLKDLV